MRDVWQPTKFDNFGMCSLRTGWTCSRAVNAAWKARIKMKHEISIDADKPHFLIEDEMNSLFAFDPKREMGQQFYDRERLGLIYPMSMDEYEDALFMLNDDLGKFDHPEVDIPWVSQALLALWGGLLQVSGFSWNSVLGIPHPRTRQRDVPGS